MFKCCHFFDRVKKMKLKTMSFTNKIVKLTSQQGKVVEYQDQGTLFITLLMKSQMLKEPISIDRHHSPTGVIIPKN